MKRFIRSFISTVFYAKNYSGGREGVVVLMYHRVNDALPPGELVVPVQKFWQQMFYLKEHCDVISMEQFLLSRQSSVVSHQKPQVLITLDDGYMDNYTNAYPVLKEFGLPATIFLITGMIGTDKKRPRYQNLPDPDMLSWASVQEMEKNGITFGAHTANHPHLDRLSYEEQRAEAEGSMAALGSWHLSPVTSSIFCYPYGDHSQDTLKLMDALGVKAAFTMKPGINTAATPSLELVRIGISGLDTMFDFKKKIAGAFDALDKTVQGCP